MQQSVSRRIRTSLIQLIIGIILVGFARSYLKDHPAEMQTIKSSFATARQKVTQMISSIMGQENTTITGQKEQALGSVKAIIEGIQDCDPSASIVEYQLLYDAISNASLSEFARNGIQYYNQTREAYERMQVLCNQEASSGGRDVSL